MGASLEEKSVPRKKRNPWEKRGWCRLFRPVLTGAGFGSAAGASGQVHPRAPLGPFPSPWPTLPGLLCHLPGRHSSACLGTEAGRVRQVCCWPEGGVETAGAEGSQDLGTRSAAGRGQDPGTSPGLRLWSPFTEFPFQPLLRFCSVAVGPGTGSPHWEETPQNFRWPAPLLPERAPA